jgi:hypothetical protein
MYDEETSLQATLRLARRAILRNKINCTRRTIAALALSSYRLDSLLRDADGQRDLCYPSKCYDLRHLSPLVPRT